MDVHHFFVPPSQLRRPGQKWDSFNNQPVDGHMANIEGQWLPYIVCKYNAIHYIKSAYGAAGSRLLTWFNFNPSMDK